MCNQDFLILQHHQYIWCFKKKKGLSTSHFIQFHHQEACLIPWVPRPSQVTKVLRGKTEWGENVEGKKIDQCSLKREWMEGFMPESLAQPLPQALWNKEGFISGLHHGRRRHVLGVITTKLNPGASPFAPLQRLLCFPLLHPSFPFWVHCTLTL